MQMADIPYDLPDARGHFGPYGGVFVAETLIRALDELKEQYARFRKDPGFVAEFEDELAHYVGRPSPVYHAKRLSEKAGGAQIVAVATPCWPAPVSAITRRLPMRRVNRAWPSVLLILWAPVWLRSSRFR